MVDLARFKERDTANTRAPRGLQRNEYPVPLLPVPVRRVFLFAGCEFEFSKKIRSQKARALSKFGSAGQNFNYMVQPPKMGTVVLDLLHGLVVDASMPGQIDALAIAAQDDTDPPKRTGF